MDSEKEIEEIVRIGLTAIEPYDSRLKIPAGPYPAFLGSCFSFPRQADSSSFN